MSWRCAFWSRHVGAVAGCCSRCCCWSVVFPLELACWCRCRVLLQGAVRVVCVCGCVCGWVCVCARFEAGAASGALLLEWRVRFGGGLLVPLQGAAVAVCVRCKGCRMPLQGVAAGASINNMSTTAPPISTMSIKITSIGAVQQPSRLHPSGLCASTLRPSTLRASTPNPSRLCLSTLHPSKPCPSALWTSELYLARLQPSRLRASTLHLSTQHPKNTDLSQQWLWALRRPKLRPSTLVNDVVAIDRPPVTCTASTQTDLMQIDMIWWFPTTTE